MVVDETFDVHVTTVRKGLMHLVNCSEGFGASGLNLSCCICSMLVVRWGGETGSPPLKSNGFFFMNGGFFGGRGIARLPSSSQLPRVHLRRRCVLRRRKDCTQAFLFTTSACTSEEEGKAFFLTKWASSSEEEGQVLLLAMSVSTCSSCFVCLEHVSFAGSPRVVNALGLGNNACVGLLVTATHLEENSSGASWDEGVAVGSRFHSPRGRPLEGSSGQEFQVAGL